MLALEQFSTREENRRLPRMSGITGIQRRYVAAEVCFRRSSIQVKQPDFFWTADRTPTRINTKKVSYSVPFVFDTTARSSVCLRSPPVIQVIGKRADDSSGAS